MSVESLETRRPLTASAEPVEREQPIGWWRAIWVGMLGAAMMMAFVDCFFMLGETEFSFENYVGSLMFWNPSNPRTWVPGFLANLVFGGLSGIIYAYIFENYTGRATARAGIRLGFVHALLAGALFFPFINVLHDELGLELYANGFGFLGSSVSPATPILIVVGHLIFGATMGAFYGPVGVERLRARNFEPGEMGQPYVDPDVITAEEDPADRVAV